MFSILDSLSPFPQKCSKKLRKIALFESGYYPFAEAVRNGFIDTLSDSDPLGYSFVPSRMSDIKRILPSLVSGRLCGPISLVSGTGAECLSQLRTTMLENHMEFPLIYTDVKAPERFGVLDQAATKTMTGIAYRKDRQHERIMHLLHLFPHLRSALVVGDPDNHLELVPEEAQEIITLLAQRGVHAELAPVRLASEERDKIGHVIRALAGGMFDVMIILRDQTTMKKVPLLSELAEKYKVPLFTSDIESATVGAAFGCGESGYELGAQTACRAQQMLTVNEYEREGFGPGTFEGEYGLWVNRASMRAQGMRLEGKALAWVRARGVFV